MLGKELQLLCNPKFRSKNSHVCLITELIAILSDFRIFTLFNTILVYSNIQNCIQKSNAICVDF